MKDQVPSRTHTLLVVDDEPINLSVVATYLELEGFEVLAARDGADGIEIAQMADPDLILLDVMMPGIDGFETCRRLKENPRTAEIPVIFLTALADEENKLKGFDAGGVDYVTKPLYERELLARVGTHLRLRDAHRMLGESEARMRAIFSSATVCINLLDNAGQYLQVNDCCLGFFGYPREELLGRSCLDLTHPEERVCGAQVLQEIVSGARAGFEGDKRFLRKDGSVFWGSHWLSPVHDEQGRCQGLVCVITDLTGRRRAEEEIRKLFRAVEQSYQTVVITGLDGAIQYVNPAFSRVTGFPADEALNKNPKILQSGVHDAEFYRGMWRTLLAGETWRGEICNRRKDGALYWEDATISPIRDEAGATTHYLAVKQDITERKQAEEGQRLAAAVFETTGEAILVTDGENRVVAVNPAFSRITGFLREEVIGAPPALFDAEHHDSEFFDGLWRTLRETGGWRGEIWSRRKDGAVYPARFSFAAVRDAAGSIVQHVAVFSDISQQKQLEELLIRQAQFDPLTGIGNRILFHDRLRAALSRARRQQVRIGLVYVDLDGFKAVNDRMGHEAGDRVLTQTALLLRQSVREEDTVARLGGDEFALILGDMDGEPGVIRIARRILAALAFDVTGDDGHRLPISASVGIAFFPDHADDGDALLRAADQAMYRAKHAGKNTWAFPETANGG